MRNAAQFVTVLVGCAVGCAASLWGQAGSTKPRPFQPKAPPDQPIAFSHKTHSAAALKCLDCHTIRAPGDAAGFPAESTCMGCHLSVKKESPAIEKLAGFAARKQPVPWVRVYRLPKTVYFSHEVHHKNAKVDCAECHGPVADKDSLGQDKSIARAD